MKTGLEEVGARPGCAVSKKGKSACPARPSAHTRTAPSMQMPAHWTELNTNAPITFRPHRGGRSVSNQPGKDLKSSLYWGLLRVALTLRARSGVKGQAAHSCLCPVLLAQWGFVDCRVQACRFISNLVWKHCVQNFPGRYFRARGNL